MLDQTLSGSFQELRHRLRQLRLIPVVELHAAAAAVPLGEALLAANLPCAEIVFRTPAARDALEVARQRFPELLLGAGTVLSIEQLKAAAACGVDFVVSPGVSMALMERSLDHGIPLIPGVCTPTDIELARSEGFELLKFFPAEAAGGVRLLRALCGPYRDVSFIPTGGIDASNLKDYLELPQVVACGGSWIVDPKLIQAGMFARVQELARVAVKIAGAAP